MHTNSFSSFSVAVAILWLHPWSTHVMIHFSTLSSQFVVPSYPHCMIVAFSNTDFLYCFCAQWILSLLTGDWLLTAYILDQLKTPVGSPYMALVWIAQKKWHLTMLSVVALVSVATETCLLRHYHTVGNADMSQYIQILKKTVFWVVTEYTLVKVYQHFEGTLPPWW
jgi:hypothetical protein